MPKVSPPTFPLSGLVAFHKPSGPTSNAVLDSLKRLFADSPLFAEPGGVVGSKPKGKGRGSAPSGVKMGQGGTLDPLADGILVVGVNRGTKQLGRFLQCSKEYRTTAILGCSTDSYDSMGAVDATAAWEHITPDLIESVLDRFRGEIMQMPPIYSALKMDGKPLYEYARLGLPLPRPIEARKCTVHELVLESFQPSRSVDPTNGHAFEWPTKRLGNEEKEQAEKTRQLIEAAAKSGEASTESKVDPAPAASTSAAASSSTDALDQPTVTPPVFTLRMTVSSGTYVRSIVNDVAQALSTLATVVVLTRIRQGEFSASAGNVVPWESVREAAEEQERQYLTARPAILAEKTRKREEAKAKQKEKTRLEREAKRRTIQSTEEEEAMNTVEDSSSAAQAASVAASAAVSATADVKPEDTVALHETDIKPAEVQAKPEAEAKPRRRTMDELYDWEKEILAKFEEHLT